VLYKSAGGPRFAGISVSAHCDPLQAGNLDLLRNRNSAGWKVGAKFANTIAGHPQTDDQWQRWRTDMRKLGDFAESHGVMLCLETHGAIIGRNSDARRAIEMIDHPMFASITTRPISFTTLASGPTGHPSIISLISHVHVKDKVGEGRMEFFPPLEQDD